MKNECIPLYRPGQDVTAKASVALTGRRLCAVTGNRSGTGLVNVANTDLQNLYVIGLPAARGQTFGVVGYDVAAGDPVPVKREGILPIEAANAIAAFQEVEVDALGRVNPVAAGGTAIGRCMTGVAGGGFAEVELYRGSPVR